MAAHFDDPDSVDLAPLVRPGDLVVWGQACGEPRTLTEALMAQRHEIGNRGRFRCFLGIPAGDTVRPEHADRVDLVAYCATGANRALVKAGVLDVLPSHYSTLPWQLSGGPMAADVVLVQVGPPDEQGRYPLGLAEDYLPPAIGVARVVVAEVNDQVPKVRGSRTLGEDEIDLAVHTSRRPAEIPLRKPDDTIRCIAARIADLIGDGATLQFGVGGLSDAVLPLLTDRRDLGIHSGLLGDAAGELLASGAVTGAAKSVDPGVAVTGMVTGSAPLFAQLDGHPSVQLRGTDHVHAHEVLAAQRGLTAINAALEVDLSGAVNAEVVGGRYVGAIGGAVDFLRGAARARDGLPIVGLPSSGIVATLSGPTSTARSDAGLVVTERGVADLRGRTLAERRERLLAIADPARIEELETCAVRLGADR